MLNKENKNISADNDAIYQKLISKMTLAEKIGQMFQVGFNDTKITSGIKEMIAEYYVGGIIYFRRNIESLLQLSELSQELQNLSIREGSGLPLIISIDQEGGIVNRITEVTHFPGNMTLGATKNTKLAKKTGQLIAKQLKGLGINMDFAPVLDVNNNPLNLVIGTRSFGGDPPLVADLGIAFIEGMQAEGVIACAKHFPGHGDTAIDSHLALPVVKFERERLGRIEFYPFKRAIEAGVDSIMTAHIYFPALESREGVPATLSYNVLTGLLRKELGFTGIIITDCMEMKAIADGFGTTEGSIRAIEAGADIVLVSHSLDKQREAIKAVVEAAKKGRVTEERINESVLKILELKNKRIGLTILPISDYSKINKKLEEETAYQISREGVTLVKDDHNLIPVGELESKKVLFMDFFSDKMSHAGDSVDHKDLLADSLRDEGLVIEQYTFPENCNKLPSLEEVGLLIIFCLNVIHNPYQINIIKELNTMCVPLIAISVNPYDLQAFPQISTFLAIYDYSPSNLRVVSEIIVGKYKAQGILPVILKY